MSTTLPDGSSVPMWGYCTTPTTGSCSASWAPGPTITVPYNPDGNILQINLTNSLKVPTSIVIGTSLFQIIFVQAYVTVLQSVQNQTVDLLLALILTLGGVVGAQFGGRWGARLPAEQLRLLMALVVLAVAGGLLYQLVATPRELFAIVTLGGSL